MQFLLNKKNRKTWSIVLAFLMVVQMVAGIIPATPANAAANTAATKATADGRIAFGLPVSSLEITANGSFNEWGSGTKYQLQDTDGNGTYTVDITGLTPDTAYEYKYLINGQWYDGDNLSATSDAGGKITLSYTPTFSVAGSFNGWTQTPMTKQGAEYGYTTDILSNGDYEYKFIAKVNGLSDFWFIDPTNPEIANTNSKITVSVTSTISADSKILFNLSASSLEITANGSFNSWGSGAKYQLQDADGDGTFTVDITGLTPNTAYEYKYLINGQWYDGANLSTTADAEGKISLSYAPTFNVAGSFNSWAQTPMAKQGSTYKYSTGALANGDYEYKFIAKAAGLPDFWFNDPTNTQTANSNSKISVLTTSTISTDGKIIFTLPASSLQVTANGSFNGWGSNGAYQLQDIDGDGTYTADITGLTPDTAYEYKYLINGQWYDGANLTASSDAAGKLTLSYAPAFNVAGSFNNWTQASMNSTSGIHQYITGSLMNGDYEYKFIAKAAGLPDLWFVDPTNTATANTNSKVSVTTGSNSLQMVSTSPTKEAANVATNISNIQVTFTEDIDITPGAAITVSEGSGQAVGGTTVSANSANLVITLSGNLAYSTTYIVSIPAGAIWGKKTGTENEAITFSFTTKPDLESPMINGDQVTFNYKGDGSETRVIVKGEFNSWNAEDMVKGQNNVWSLTKTIPAGAYQYGIATWSPSTTDQTFGDWKADPLNPKRIGSNPALFVPGILIDAANDVQVGGSIDLQARKIDSEGNSSLVVPEWTLKTPKDGISISDGKLSVAANYQPTAGEQVVVAASLDGYTAERAVNIISVMYEYTINYYRFDGRALDWDMWLWEDGENGSAYTFNKGMVGEFAQAVYKFPSNRMNLIVRPKSWSTQEITRVVQIQSGTSVEVWVIQDVPGVYYNKEEADVSPRVRVAFMDSINGITANLSHPLRDGDLTSFKLVDALANTEIPVTAARTGDNQIRLTVQNPDAVDVSRIYTVQSARYLAGNVTMRGVLDDPKYSYIGSDLGLTYSNTGSTFKVWAPTASKVSLALYDNAGIYDESGTVKDHTGGQETAMTKVGNGVWATSVSGDLNGKFYMYKVEFLDGKVNYAVDPYARAVSANGQRTAIVDLSDTNPASWNPMDKPTFVAPNDAVIYELQLRDLSMSSDSGIANKGKFKALTETGAVGPNGVTTGIDHIAELGVTHVHLLPAYDFGAVDELKVDDPTYTGRKYNWGYDPENYNVPEGSYSSNPADPKARITEFKEMVQALHGKGIRVVMDVVYNHTFSVPNGPFDKIVPGYFYRLDNSGRLSNGSGTGNEVASERVMVRKFIKESVRYWATEYGVDGFRFDLMGLIDVDTMRQITDELKNEVDANMLIYGEPWTGGTTPLASSLQTLKGAQRGKGFAVFNDNLRGAIKGDSDGAGKGFATGQTAREGGVVAGMMGAINDFTDNPTETINYVTAHDNLALWDKVIRAQGLEQQEGFLSVERGVLGEPDATTYNGSIEAAIAGKANVHSAVDRNNVLANETVKRGLLANGIVLTSQGISFIHAGEEFLRTKFGERDAYTGPDDLTKFRWQWKSEFKQVFDYYKGLVELRKSHPAFRMSTREAVQNNLQVLKQDGNVIVYQLKNFANNDTWKNIVVVYNANSAVQQVALPANTAWKVVVDHTAAGTSVLRTVSGNTVSVEGLSMMVLYDEEEALYTPVATSIEMAPSVVGLKTGGFRAVKAVVKDQKGRVMLSENVSWATSNADVATVAENGRVYAAGEGTANITATAGNATARVTVNVGELIPTSIVITGSESVYETRSIELSATVIDQYGQEMQNQRVEWSSSDVEAAMVDANGRVTGVGAGVAIIKAKIGSVEATKQIIVNKYFRKYVIFKYVRPDRDYSEWNIWIWNTGIHNGQFDLTQVGDVAIAQIEVAPDVASIGFVLRKGTTWDYKDPYGDDRLINIAANEPYTKVVVTTGVGEFVTVPPAVSPVFKDGNIVLNYRDDELFKDDALATLGDVKVEIEGQAFDMTYDAVNEMYTYTIQNPEVGEYKYRFIVPGKSAPITDPKNLNVRVIDNVAYSVVVFKKPNLSLNTQIEPKAAINYTENTVLKVNVVPEPNEPVNIKELYADLTALGGRARVNIDRELMELTVSVKENISAGAKAIPVIAVDQYGNRYTTTANIEVTEKQTGGNADFDWDEARIYFLLTDRFSNGDTTNDNPNNVQDTPSGYDKGNLETYHGGDLRGIINKLDYLQDLGINTVWITPIVDNIDWDLRHDRPGYQYAYHGYWAKNFEKIDEHIGNVEDLKELIEKAHDKGMKIMVDVVLNHAGYGLKPGENGDDIANFVTEEDCARFAGMLRNGGSDLVKGETSGLPDFMTEIPDVRNKIIAWQTAWLEKARTTRGDTIDYFRLDTVNNLDYTTLEAFKAALTKIKSDFKVIGESWNASVDSNGERLGNGRMDSLLDFSFKYSAQNFVNGAVDEVESYMERRESMLDNTATMGQFLSSHDEDDFLYRILSNEDKAKYTAGTLEPEKLNEAKAKVKVAAALQITSKGQPVIYYGEELGQSGRNSGNMDNGEFSENRKDMPWQTGDYDMHAHYQKLLKARANHSKVFAKGTRTKVAGGNTDGYVVFERKYNDESILVGLNIDTVEKHATFKVPFAAGTRFVDEYSGKTYTVDVNGNITVTIPGRDAGGTVILVKEVVNNDAALKDIKVDGKTIAGFASDRLEYNVELPYGTKAVPTVTAEANDDGAVVDVTPAAGLPGATVIKVTAEDGVTVKAYKVNFTVALNTNASLEAIKINGVMVTGFNPDKLTYLIQSKHGKKHVPTITAVAADKNAKIVITQAAEVPGTAIIVVTAEDGKTTRTYKVSFTKDDVTDANLKEIKINGKHVSGFNNKSTEYTVYLPSGTTAVPVVTAVAKDDNARVDISNDGRFPGTAKVIVTAADGVTIRIYKIYFKISPKMKH
ncbi:MAG: type I pullulanase [Clostridia bacterium]|nr:type I pullulanase [Clostridia bacterium]